MKLKYLLSLIGSAVIIISLAGCGQTYELVSLEITPNHPNLVGIGAMQQITLTARYSNTNAVDVTQRGVYSITAPSGTTLVVPSTAVTVSPAGMVQVVQGACTWVNTGTTTAPIYGTTPYVLKATFDHHEAVGFLSVASIAGCDYQKTN